MCGIINTNNALLRKFKSLKSAQPKKGTTMKMKLALLLLIAVAISPSTQAQVSVDKKEKIISAAKGREVRALKFDVPLDSPLQEGEKILYTYVSRKQTNNFIIPRADTGVRESTEFPGKFWASVDLPYLPVGKRKFTVISTDATNPPPTGTNWSTTTIVASVSPFDPNQEVQVQAGQKDCLFAAVRFTGKGVLKTIKLAQVGIMWEGQPNLKVVVKDYAGGSLATLPATPTDGVYFTAKSSSGIPIDGYVDVLIKGDIPQGTVRGRYVLIDIWKDTDVEIVETSSGFESRLVIIPYVLEDINHYKSEFTSGIFFSGSPSQVR